MNGLDALNRSGGKLIITVLERGHGDKAVTLTKKAGAQGGTVMLGHCSSGNQVLDFLSLGEIENDVLLTLVDDKELDPVMSGLRRFKVQGKRKAGFVVLLDIQSVFKPILQGQGQVYAQGFGASPGQGATLAPSDDASAEVTRPAKSGASAQGVDPSFSDRSSTMNKSSDYSLIMFIVNKGYADELMTAARKAGATGGTVLHARGTGKEEDVKFFGITLVPEKEILLIVAENSHSEAIVAAIKAVPELNQAGAGIAVKIDAQEFFVLGKNPE
jgi:nitrogen regulatory protein PII